MLIGLAAQQQQQSNMPKPLIDLIISKQGIPFLVILTGILHMVSAYFFNCHSFFMLIWTTLATRVYMSYISVDLVDYFTSIFDRTLVHVTTSVSNNVTTAVRGISTNLQDLGAQLQTGTSFASIANEFSKHKIGIAFCAKTLTKCDKVVDVVEEVVKVSSLLGLESSLVNTTLGRLTSAAGIAMEPMEQHGLEEVEKFIPLIASSAAMMDVEFGEVSVSKHMDKFARNTKSAEIITQHMRKIAEASGLIKPQNWQVLQDLNKMVNDLKEDHIWVVQTLALHGSQFVNPMNYERVKKYRQAVDRASKTLRSINLPEIKNNQIVTECNSIIMKAQDYLNQIESIRQSIGLRPVPVGICIQGPSQVGKTTIVRELMRRVKEKLRNNPELFGDPVNWAQWDANQREEFDSGYCGQEIVYMDDAFQDKTNKDHLMWYTYISSTCVGTIQGVAEQKGLPFRALICITTCNEFPTKSIAVSHINALHQRFPLSYRFKKLRDFSKWNEGGSNFDHLEIEYGSMADFAANVPTRRNMKGVPAPSTTDFPKTDLDGMVDQICQSMINNMTFYNLRMQTATNIPVEMHGGSDDEDQDSLCSDFLDDVFGEIPTDTHSELLSDDPEEDDDTESLSSNFMDQVLGEIPNTVHTECFSRNVTFNEVVEVHELPSSIEEDVLPEQVPEDLRGSYVQNPTIRGTQSEDHDSTMRIDRLLRAVAEDMNNAVNRAQYDTIYSVGDWIHYLNRAPQGGATTAADLIRPNRTDFLAEDGLYEFLSTLGAWVILDSEREAFEMEFMRQPILKLKDHMDTEYLWGPTLGLGTAFYLVSPNLIFQLEESFLTGWRLRRTRWKRKLLAFLVDPYAQRLFAQHTIPIAVASWFPSLAVQPAWQIALYLRGFTQGYYRRGIHPFWRGTTSVLGNIVNVLRLWEAPWYFVAKGFDYLEKITMRLAKGMTSVMLQLLEYFGVDVQGLWNDIANLTNQMISQAIILGVTSVLIYVAYKLIKFLFKKDDEPVEMHSSKNEFGKNSRRLQRQKIVKQKTVQVRAFQRRGADDLVCAEECDVEDEDIQHEDTIYTKIGICNDKESFYGVKPLKYLFEILEEDPQAICGEFVKCKNSHILAHYIDADDFLVEKSNLKFIKKIPITINRSDGYGVAISYDLVGTEEQVCQQHEKFLKRLDYLKVLDWQGDIDIRRIDDIYHLKVYLVGLSTTIQGTPRNFVSRELRNLNAIYEDEKGLKTLTTNTTAEILDQHGSDDSMCLMNSLVEKHQVYMSIANYNDVDSNELSRMTFGIGHFDTIIFNAHMYEIGEFVRFWRWNKRKVVDGYQICHVESIDTVRDIGIARIVSKERFRSALMSMGIRQSCNLMASMVDRFRSIEPYLCDETNWRAISDDQSCLCFLPTAGSLAIGRVGIEGLKSRFIRTRDTVTSQLTDYICISQLNMSLPLARKGDCGGLILSYRDRYQSKIIGFHCGGTASNWYGAILRKEDLALFTQHGSEDDVFSKFIVGGEPVDLPDGPGCTFLGKYKFKTKPAGDLSLAHWKYSPFHEQFEEQLQPGPLDANDPRIKVEVPCNSSGFKSLLLIPNGVMCSKLPEMDRSVLAICEEHLTYEMQNKIGNIKKTPSNMEDLLEIALNGDRENIFCTGMELDKACGIPWNEIPGCSKKKHFLQNNDGFISFIDDINGDRLKSRVILKLQRAKRSERSISLSNSKLKDALIKISAVETAKTRVFHCIPVDKVICDAALFGNFKEAYSQAFLQLNHAIGVNPHSLQWKAIYEHLNKHNNVFDMDFSNYDKHLHSELMHTAFRMIRKVIQAKAKDEWDEARAILEEESIETYVVDYDTVYKTERGNKSGEYLTTVINCICNDILSYYTWIKTTENFDLSEFRNNVSGVSFGDDKIESVSDEYAEKYNYFSAKEVMSSIGHIITPGAKDGVERKFCPIDQAQFLKRGIVEWEDYIVAPLLQRSIESPFVWTQIETSEHVIWYNLVEQTMFEALLHGEQYYDSFRNKLSQCIDLDLRRALAALLSVTYSVAKRKYLNRYHNNNSHLCTSKI